MSELCSIYRIYIVQEDIHLNQIFHNWKSIRTNTLRTYCTSSFNFLQEEIEHILSLSLKSPISMKLQS